LPIYFTAVRKGESYFCYSDNEEDAIIETDSGESDSSTDEFTKRNDSLSQPVQEHVQEQTYASHYTCVNSSADNRSRSVSVDQVPSFGESDDGHRKHRHRVASEPLRVAFPRPEYMSTHLPHAPGHHPTGDIRQQVPRKTSSDESIDALINRIVQQKIQDNKTEVKRFDAAILYHRHDYDSVIKFMEELISITRHYQGEELKIEVYDSEEHFSQSKVLAVGEVAMKCSLLFCYLTNNFRSGELTYFIEEAIAMSRFHSSSSSHFTIKAVHTLPKHLRNYSTPPGLMSTNPIDWFDRDSSFTLDKVKALIREAIKKRKTNQTREKNVQGIKDVRRFEEIVGVEQSQLPQVPRVEPVRVLYQPHHHLVHPLHPSYPPHPSHPSHPPHPPHPSVPLVQPIVHGSAQRIPNMYVQPTYVPTPDINAFTDPYQVRPHQYVIYPAGNGFMNSHARGQAFVPHNTVQYSNVASHQFPVNTHNGGYIQADNQFLSPDGPESTITQDQLSSTGTSNSTESASIPSSETLPRLTRIVSVPSDLASDDVEIDTNNLEFGADLETYRDSGCK